MDIYVGNLPYDIDEDTLRTVFSEYGTVDNVKIIEDRIKNRPKGFAFLSMSNWKEAQSAIKALDGKEVEGREIKVNQARPKEERKPRSDNRDRRF
jgi:cold-inducible RNA-binding protein